MERKKIGLFLLCFLLSLSGPSFSIINAVKIRIKVFNTQMKKMDLDVSGI